MVLGVLIVVLRPHGVAAGGFDARELHVVLIASLRALQVSLFGGPGDVRGMPLLRAAFERAWRSRRAGHGRVS
jgi:hypothetical protein